VKIDTAAEPEHCPKVYAPTTPQHQLNAVAIVAARTFAGWPNAFRKIFSIFQ